MKEIFRSFLDLEEFLYKKRFTILHRMVLDIVPLDLEQQLQVATSGINTQCSTGKTALIFAVIRADLPKVQILLRYGAEVRVSDNFGYTAIHYAAKSYSNDSCQVIRALVQFSTSSSNTDLHRIGRSIEEDYSNRAERARCVSAGVQMTPLLLAVAHGRTETVKVLIENGADIDGTNIHGATPLLFAVENNHHLILKLLLDLGPNIQPIDNKERVSFITAPCLRIW